MIFTMLHLQRCCRLDCCRQHTRLLLLMSYGRFSRSGVSVCSRTVVFVSCCWTPAVGLEPAAILVWFRVVLLKLAYVPVLCCALVSVWWCLVHLLLLDQCFGVGLVVVFRCVCLVSRMVASSAPVLQCQRMHSSVVGPPMATQALV